MNANLKMARLWLAPIVLCLAGACASSNWDQEEVQERMPQIEETIATFRDMEPDLQRFFDESAGYAVYPTVGTGGLVVGGAHGDGVLFQNGEIVGTTSITEVSFGAQVGGQTFSEIIFFQNDESLNDFKDGTFDLGASASAIIVERGAARAASFHDGVAVFVHPKQGLMAAATVEGQSFTYTPLNVAAPAN